LASQHIATLLKYTGISFISGAVNHGMFSTHRAVWTAVIGIALFVAGAALEHRLVAEKDQPASLIRTLLVGALLSIGLGFFTGGLQHFPDSPERSSWVVPTGFALSVIALAMSTANSWSRLVAIYLVSGTLAVTGACYGAWQWLEANPNATPTHQHAHDESHSEPAELDHSSAHTPSKTTSAATQAYIDANQKMHAGMNTGFVNDADRDFLAGMIPHHQGAIDMAQVALTHGKDARVKKMAQDIVQGQSREIKDMALWLTELEHEAKPHAHPSKGQMPKHSSDHH
jgi:hypothetical protein